MVTCIQVSKLCARNCCRLVIATAASTTTRKKPVKPGIVVNKASVKVMGLSACECDMILPSPGTTLKQDPFQIPLYEHFPKRL